MAEPDDERPPMAVAMAWVSRIFTISAQMVLPGLAGIWLDHWLGTKVLLTIVGFAGGLSLAIWQLTRLNNASSSSRDRPRRKG